VKLTITRLEQIHDKQNPLPKSGKGFYHIKLNNMDKHLGLFDQQSSDSQNYEESCQYNGKLKERFLNTPASPVDGIRLAEDATQATAFNLK
jgi:hypothetical protein